MIEQSTLYIVSTPIGNLGDISLRALEVLKDADFILCEDTRRSLKLLNHYKIKNKLVSYHKFNEKETVNKIIEKLGTGESCALISDAGTPVISDPGNILTKALIENKIDFYVIPGANALLPALIMSGFDASHFEFRGFLPKKKNEIKKELISSQNTSCPVIYYIAPSKLSDTLTIADEIFPQRRLSLSKELTKLHEATFRGTAKEITAMLGEEIKGEYALVLDAVEKSAEIPSNDVLKMQFDELVKTLSKNEALKVLAKEYDLPKKRLYEILMIK